MSRGLLEVLEIERAHVQRGGASACGAPHHDQDQPCQRIAGHLATGEAARESHAAYAVWTEGAEPSWATWSHR